MWHEIKDKAKYTLMILYRYLAHDKAALLSALTVGAGAHSTPFYLEQPTPEALLIRWKLINDIFLENGFFWTRIMNINRNTRIRRTLVVHFISFNVSGGSSGGYTAQIFEQLTIIWIHCPTYQSGRFFDNSNSITFSWLIRNIQFLRRQESVGNIFGKYDRMMLFIHDIWTKYCMK